VCYILSILPVIGEISLPDVTLGVSVE